MGELVTDLEEDARRRFVRWDANLWQGLLSGPAQQLAEALQAAGVPEAQASQVLESYLRLGAEAIGLGYLFPSSVGSNFFTLAWNELVPRHLAQLPPGRQAATLAACWNLGENLENAPLWLRRIFMRLCAGLGGLDHLEDLVADVSHRALEAPPHRLGDGFALAWVHLASEDHRFLPGSLHFVAPTVACVHDRHRTAAGGRDAATVGVWLDETPLLLGPMGCQEQPGDSGLDFSRLEALERQDPRASDWFAMASNEWRAAVTLETSQFLVVLSPA